MRPDSAAFDVKLTAEDSTSEKTKVFCRSCRNNTNHSILKSILVEKPWDRDPETQVWQRYQIVQCQGCDILAFLAGDGDSTVDEETGKPHEQWEVFPRWHSERDILDGANALPKHLKQIYTETMRALNRNQPILCGMGIRAVVETVAKERGAKGKDLEKRIDHLVELKVLTADGAKILHKLRSLGNKAAHEAKAHNADELALAMDVVDHLLAAVYILPKRAARAFK